MRVVLSCVGKFHHFDLARQLESKGLLAGVLTGYPKIKLREEGIPLDKIWSFPWLQAPYMASVKAGGYAARVGNPLGELARKAHDQWAARVMPKCDVLIGLSGHNLLAGRKARALGAKWICDRGSAHIRYQEKVLTAEYALCDLKFSGIPAAVVQQEMTEYAECDAITIPSSFAVRSFIEEGVDPKKLRRVPYGVDLRRFYPVSKPDDSKFDVLYVGTVTPRKGVRYLVDAFRALAISNKSLTIIGPIDPRLAGWVDSISSNGVVFLGPKKNEELKDYFSRSHVFVLPSVEDGFGLVVGQAMACACPVICSTSAGGADLIIDGIDGFCVTAGDVGQLTAKLGLLAYDRDLRSRMANAALGRVKHIGGWSNYGRDYISVINGLFA
jgi:alpha-maltose-1-phosphate synthase